MTDRTGWVATLSVPEAFLNRLALRGIGEGVHAPTLRHGFQLPMMGEVVVSVDVSILGATFELRDDLGGRMRATVRARGRIGFESDPPSQPSTVHLTGVVLVDPLVRHNEDRTLSLGLDVEGAELVEFRVDDAVGDDVPDELRAQAQVNQLVVAAIGQELFAMLQGAMDEVAATVGGSAGELVGRLGVDVGHADVEVREGLLVVGFPAAEEAHGRAQHVAPPELGLGVGVASASLPELVTALGERALGDLPLPVEVHLEPEPRGRVAGRVRPTRVLPEFLPDLRGALRWTVRPRVVDGHLELGVADLWVDLPGLGPLRGVSRWAGSFVRRIPVRLRVPTRVEVPVRPPSPGAPDPATMVLTVADLTVDDGMVGIVVRAEL